ncbi:hypothetical protein CRUP_017476 [Coryphaenoides rupestris]|nr:hypothetical protein CRUP_017476 [Coryphaenoides rupestris]
MLVDGAYAFIRYKKGSLMTLKLYGRSTINMSELMLTRFEQLAEEHGMSLAYMFPFPNFDCDPTC